MALILATAFSTPVFATDLAPNPVEPSAPVAEPFSWTGFYVGAHVGGTDTGGKLKAAATSVQNKSADVSRSGFHSGLGFEGGVQGGYNYQINQVVLGFEADADFGSSKNSQSAIASYGSPYYAATTVKDSSEWGGSLRGRLGYAFDNWLPYVAAGVAIRDDKLSAGTAWHTFFSSPSPFGTSSETQVGFIGGLGLEYAFDEHWSIRAEGLYALYPKHSATFVAGDGNGGTSTIRASSNPQVFTFDVGLNYRF
ncbi:outer membrane protein [Labrys monachus]|uniref:Outer membrane immunogenic protein n=1 Tax=Labrys monachus TaxID=217067 RepID=A0ABU0FL50_9HYPH|nr:outer membrane beta-barrel protein [Labrys monachus]MDQ0395337.1 outer membrane immunogenic protein [Labrys monachus]